MALAPITHPCFSSLQEWLQNAEKDSDSIQRSTILDCDIGTMRILSYGSEGIELKVKPLGRQADASRYKTEAVCYNFFLRKVSSILKSFPQFCSLELLDLSNNGIQNFSHFSWESLCNLRELNLSGNELSSFSFDVFKDLRRLKKLDLSCNKLKKILENISIWKDVDIVNFPKLEEIFLSDNHLTEFPEFYALRQVKVLFCSRNKFNKIKTSSFSNLKHLICLDLSENNIEIIAQDWFYLFQVLQSSHTLKILNLSYNCVPRIYKMFYRKSSQLKDVDLSNNKIEYINRICNLRHLECLNASWNFLQVPPNFRNMVYLRELNLSHNNLISIDFTKNKRNSIALSPFEGCKSLSALNLSWNFLANLSKEAFPYLPKLESLDLSANKIHELGRECFNNLPELRDLNISNNELNSIKKKSFYSLPKLISLRLNHNQLSFLETGCFEGLFQLLQLGLSNNKLQELPKGCFEGLLQLATINLSKNQLQELTAIPWEDPIRLTDINLSSNRLTKITNNCFVKQIHLSRVDLSENDVVITDSFLFESSQAVTVKI